MPITTAAPIDAKTNVGPINGIAQCLTNQQSLLGHIPFYVVRYSCDVICHWCWMSRRHTGVSVRGRDCSDYRLDRIVGAAMTTELGRVEWGHIQAKISFFPSNKSLLQTKITLAYLLGPGRKNTHICQNSCPRQNMSGFLIGCRLLRPWSKQL
jgi:hypothetical protein